MRLGLFERLGFFGDQIIWTVEKEFQICSYLHLMPHILEEKYGEVEQLVT